MPKKRSKSNNPLVTKNIGIFALIATIAIIGLIISYSLVFQKTNLFSQAFNKNSVWLEGEEVISRGMQKTPRPVVEVILSYNQQTNPELTLETANVKQSHIPTTPPEENPSYYLDVVDVNQYVLLSVPVIPFLDAHVPPRQDENSEVIDGIVPEITQLRFSQLIEYQQSGAEIILKTNTGTQLATIPYPDKRNMPQPKMNFKRLQVSQNPRVLGTILGIPQASASNGNGTFDIVFIGDNYTNDQNSLVLADAQKFAEHFLTYEPYKSRSSQITFGVVENFQDLNCQSSATMSRYVSCDVAKVMDIVNSSGIAYDKIGVIVNSTLYGGSGGSIAVAYNGSAGAPMMVHEMAHAHVPLLDEYVLVESSAASSSQNCYKGTPPNPDWQGIVPESSYFKGCFAGDWYRSSDSSIMRSLSSQYFNPISQKLVTQSLNYYTGGGDTSNPKPTTQPSPSATPTPSTGPADTTPPSVAITSPLDGSVIGRRSKESISAVASDTVRLDRVEFYINDSLRCSDTTAPYSCPLKLSGKGSTFVIRATAFDGSNNQSSAVIQVTKE